MVALLVAMAGHAASLPFAGSVAVAHAFAEAGPLAPTPSTHDAYLDLIQPLRVKIRAGSDSTRKRIRAKVWNGRRESGSVDTRRLSVESLDCPVGVIVGAPDFDGRTAGDQDTVALAAGRPAAAKLTLELAAASFTSHSRKVPTRCSLRFMVESTTAGNIDPTPDNNVAYMEINVIDRNDPDRTDVQESRIESFRATHPGKVELRAGHASQTKVVKPVVVNGDAGERPGDELTVVVDDGDCPPGTLGEVDFDRRAEGAQPSVVVRGERKARGRLAVEVHADDFYSPGRRAMGRCHAVLTVSGPGGDSDPSNDATRMVVNVYDRNDM